MKAMISSTALDLPEHRRQVVEACLRESVFPIGMEQLPARDASGVQVSLEMVDQADIYIGVYAWRYGWVPESSDISITEMEFNRAVERQQRGELKEILIFVMHDEHDIKRRDMEADATAQKKLKMFKERASSGRVRKEFRNVDDLRGLVVQALADCKQRFEATATGKPPLSFHSPSNIPPAPKPYIAHPYVLLQTKRVIGRRDELKSLTDWITRNEEVPADTRIFSIVAIGGMGKSALTWKWFEDISPNELPNLAGRMWWSFYESDAHWENFIIRALAYTAGIPEAEVRQFSSPEREDRLLRLLNERPFLLVLDGLERILLAYARMDAAHLTDDDLDQQTANVIAGATGLPDTLRETYLEKHRLRQCADLRAGTFLRKLSRLRASRVLLSTRLYPAELQTGSAEALPGCSVLYLHGLTDDDALALWRGFIGGERSGTSEKLLPLFRAFGNYPLLLRALAGEVAQFRPAPGDFDRWREANPGFNPAALPLKNAKSHVLEFALRGLAEQQRRVLHTLAAFRMPTTWETLRALLIGPGKLCADDRTLDGLLGELEDRGLVGWDKAANRYDLHPVVRGVVWVSLGVAAKRGILDELHSFFDAAPRPPDYPNVESVEDLTATLELFDKLVRLERYDSAFEIFRNHLEKATFFRLGVNRLHVELLERLFPNGTESLPALQSTRAQSLALHSLGNAYYAGGEPGRAALLYRRAAEIPGEDRKQDVAIALTAIAVALQESGKLWESTAATRRALEISRGYEDNYVEGISLQMIGTVLGCAGLPQARIALNRALKIFIAIGQEQGQGIVSAYLAQHYLWLQQPSEALPFVQRAFELAQIYRNERDFIRVARLHGTAALYIGNLVAAEERLQHAIIRARAISFVAEELAALTALADLYRKRKEYDVARDLLDDVWTPAKRGPYPLRHADGENILAQLERDVGQQERAIEAATAAYRLAWCDGPPYAYDYGLANARKHLRELGAPEPQLSAFKETEFAPISNVELNPKDEFWVDPES
jgi:tetratricopeptide (TPR) repeat protein